MKPFPPLAAGAAAAILALAGSGALGAALARRAGAVSREQPAYAAPAAVRAESPEVRRAHGRALYFKSCAHCHGEDASGDEGPDLRGIWVSERRIASVIKRGIKGEMPSFAKKHDDAQVAELVAFVCSLPPPPDPQP